MNPLITSIKNSCAVFFSETTLAFKPVDLSRYVIAGSDMTLALDNYRSNKREVRVLRWFDDFWYYMEVNIVPTKTYPAIFVTISIFQGASDDDAKTQLFRAEWDNYNNNTVHPQPHWHIYPFKYDSKTYDDFEVYNDMKSEEEAASGFEAQVLQKKNKIIDIRNIHFAMNGQWSEKKGCIHSITDDNTIINWITGILGHIKEQLEYAR